MSYVVNLLASYGFTVTQAHAFITENIAKPELIYKTFGRYGITFSMIAELYGSETTTDMVKGYFERNGFDVSSEAPLVDRVLIQVENTLGEVINQNDVSDWLLQYNLTYLQAQNFVYSNIANPELMYKTLGMYDISFAMVAVLYGNGLTEERVRAYFQSYGLDVSSEIPVSSTKILPSILGSLKSLSVENLAVFELADERTEYVNSLITNNSWLLKDISYSFPSSMPLDYASKFFTSIDWRKLTEQEKSHFSQVVELQNKFITTKLSYSSINAEILVSAVSQYGAEAFAYYPGEDVGGDVFLNRDGGDENYYGVGGYGVFTMMHELGHAMGLDHSFEGVRLNSAYDNTYYTAMSYTLLGGYEVEALNQGSRYSTYTVDAYRTDLGIIDVAALQAIYGADMSTNAGDTLYVYNEAERAFTTASGHYLTIWDAGGNDTLDLSAAEYDSSIDLNDYTLSSVSERTSFEEAVEVGYAAGLTSRSAIDFIQDFIDDLGEQAFLNHNNLGIAYGVVIENVITGIGDDIVIDNEVNNQIYTGAGNDIIYLGAGGYDYVDGGFGNDTVVLNVNYADVERFVDSAGYHLLADDFAATLVGVENVQYLDMNESIA